MSPLPLFALAAALQLVPGRVAEFSAPLTADQRRLAGRGAASALKTAHCAIAVPADFAPDRTWPVLVVSATSDPGYNSSVRWLRDRYAAPALAAGWVVVAADPPAPAPLALDTPDLRCALLGAALDALAAQHPSSRGWPLAFAGFSGGSKHSVHLAARFARSGRSVIGLWLGGCNEDVSVAALNLYGPPRRAFRQIPVFISGGDSDAIATPVEQARVEASMRANGFARIRRESYAGGHVFHREHFAQALAWFGELRAAAPAP